jgi:DNA processing protein
MKYNDEQFKYWIWFSRIRSISSIKKVKLLEKYKFPETIYDLNDEELYECKILNLKEIDEIIDDKYRLNLEKYCDYMIKNKIELITIYDKEYPESLKEIYDSPIVLFAKGNIKLLNKKNVAIVGSRNCTEYGKNISKKFAYDLAKQNICIVSGLAKGVDKYAHIGALDAKGDTIAVIGNGLDIVYPYENKYLSERIIKNNGLIITEYIIGTRPDKMNFPARNRIISGLSKAIVVVEACIKSGSLITVDFGLEQGKDIFAVPGNIESCNSEGTNELIKQGANVVIKSQDIIEVLGD